MSSLRNWFKLASRCSLVITILLGSWTTATAQTNLEDPPRYTPEQWEELQEFARQFRNDPSLMPPIEGAGPRTEQRSLRRNQVPARGASFRAPRQDEPTQEPEVFDPFKNPRLDDPQQPADPDANFDPAPDPPQDEALNQNQQPQGDDRSNPFSDDRAVDQLKELERPVQQAQPRTVPDQREPRNWQPIPPKKPVDPTEIQRWELPPGAVFPDDTQNYGADSANRDPSRLPHSNVTPYPQGSSQAPQPHPQAQPYHPGIPAQPYLDPRQPAAQPNHYDPADPYRDSAYHAPSQQSYAEDHQAGQHNYFANAHQQWGVAGVEPCYDCNSCGVMGCEFDSEIPQFYLSGFGMAVDLRNLNSESGTLLADNGGGFGLAIGQRQGRNLRTELEYAWRSNSILGLEDANNSFDVTGKIKSQAGMANAYWEFVNFPSRSIKPYVGAGLGFARFDADLQDSLGSLTPERSKDSSFAYQFMGGINYQPTSYIDLFIEYRLFRTDPFQIETNSGFAADRYDYEANNLVGGIRWKF